MTKEIEQIMSNYEVKTTEKFYKDFPQVKLVTTHTTNLETGKSWSERRVKATGKQKDFDAVINDWYCSQRPKIELPYFIDTELDVSAKPVVKKEVVFDAEDLELNEGEEL